MKTEFMPGPPRNWRELEPHELSGISDFGAGVDQDAAIAFMRQFGYDENEAVTMFEGKVLDGRHKLFWAIEAGCTPVFRRFTGTYEEAKAYVLKKVHRQHLNASQRATIAARLANLKRGDNQHVQSCASPTSQTEAANLLNVSRRSVQQAVKVEENGVPEVKEAVSDGTLPVSVAAKVAELPAKKQRAAVKRAKKGKQALEREPGVEEEDTRPTEDKLGQTLPEEARESFDDKPRKELLKKLKDLKAEANKYLHHPSGKSMRLLARLSHDGKSLTPWTLWRFHKDVEESKPYALCPTCGGEVSDSCKTCNGSRGISKIQYDEMKSKEPLR